MFAERKHFLWGNGLEKRKCTIMVIIIGAAPLQQIFIWLFTTSQNIVYDPTFLVDTQVGTRQGNCLPCTSVA